VSLFPVEKSSANWTASPAYAKAFIENKAQFNGRNKIENSEILYAIDHGPFQVYFTKKGITYRLDKKLPRKKWDKTIPIIDEADWNRIMKQRREVNMITDLIHMSWVNSNPAVEITAIEPTQDYFSYGMGSNNINYNHIRGYKKLIYKNLYPGIDAEYEFHPVEGFKYSFVIHPGADPSLIQMRYNDAANLTTDETGNLKFATQFGDIKEHAPLSFYSSAKHTVINSSFVLLDNIVKFKIGKYDNSKKIIIDPWVVLPPSPNSQKVWEVETDNSGNVYTYAGDMPITLRKYNSAGALQWTYLTAWDSSGYWVGGMITHPSGESYISSGSNGEVRKISTAGAQQWFNNPNLLTSYEYWSFAFNCDLTKLVIGGTRLTFSIPTPIIRGTVMEINLANGALLNTVVVGYGAVIGIPPSVQEVSSICSAPNGNYYFLTLDTVGAIKDDLSSIVFKESTIYNFDYYIPGYGLGTKQPISAIRATSTHFYTQNGITVDKRNLTTGAIVATASIPGGISNGTFFGTNIQGNGGLDIDSCGNVYAGSNNAVYKFDSNLNLITSAITPGAVYDVDVSNSGEVVASGSNFVASLALSSCNVPVAICVTTMIANVSSTNVTCAGLCDGTATAAPVGGTPPFTYLWSNGASTDTISGLCPGTYSVIITDGVGLIDSATVVISEPLPITTTLSSVNASCGSNNGSATVSASGGTAPFNFSWSPVGGTDSVATGLQAGTYTITVTDANGCSVTDSVIVNSTGGPILTLDSQSNALCYGSSDGTATISATAGTPPYNYAWSTVPVQTNATATGLPAGTYTVTVTDSSGCITSQSVTISEPDSLVLIASIGNNDLCGLGNGSASVIVFGGVPEYIYSWNSNPPQDGPTAINLPFGTYVVTVIDSNGCSDSAFVGIAEAPSPILTLTGQTNVDCNGGATGTATVLPTSGTTTYFIQWSTVPVQTSVTATGLTAGTYTVIVTDINGCADTVAVTITEPPALNLAGSSTAAICGQSNGTASVNVSGGTPGYSYSWNTNPVQTNSTATGLAPGIYTATITDAEGCTSAQQVTVSDTQTMIATASSIPACGNGNGTAVANVTGGSGPYTYLWSPTGGNSSTATGLSNGIYECTITDIDGCSITTSVNVTVYPDVIANAGSDVTMEPGNSTQLSATGGTSYSWSPAAGLNCTDCQSPVASPDTTTVYCVVVTDDNGCTASTCVKVNIDIICGEVFVPDAFSPDGSNDPENEKQCVYGRCIKTMEFAIYARWGEKVFETTDQKKCWDGTYKGQKLNTGVYVYYLKATLLDGTKINRKGDVSLIR